MSKGHNGATEFLAPSPKKVVSKTPTCEVYQRPMADGEGYQCYVLGAAKWPFTAWCTLGAENLTI